MDSTSVLVRGYDIRIQRQGSCWMGEKAHGWAPAGFLPREWAETIADPTVVQAVIFPSYQARWRSDRRQHVAEYHA